MSLNDAESRELLAIACASLSQAVREGSPAWVELTHVSPRLREPGACFVTLTKHGDLRGCIGTLAAHQPLAQDVAHNAMASALRDPRFPPVSARELPDIKLEISVLSAPVDFPVRDEAELLQKLQPGVHGLIIDDGFHRATFLPAVWEQLPDAHDFVAHLKHKAGLSPNSWPASMRCQVYFAQKIG
jgi:AmmeMemoRadiSam system protein A